MLDIQFIREHKEKLIWAIRVKKLNLDLDEFFDLDAKRGAVMRVLEDLRHKKNENAELMKAAISGKDGLREQGKRLKADIQAEEQEFKILDERYEEFMTKLPTIPADDTPPGNDDAANVEVARWGAIPNFGFTPKDHIQLGKDLDLLDLETGVKVSGYRGYYVKNEAAMLQMGAMMYALQKAVQKGFRPMLPPTLIKAFALYGSGYFKGQAYDPETDEIYKIANDDRLPDGTLKKEDKFLIGTAEPSILAYYADKILDEKDLPLKLCGFSQCYRSEIGSYGKDTKGMYRVHEFMKVELVCLAPADVAIADAMHEEMIALSRELHEDLGLPYRQIRMCAGNLTVGKYKQYDMEAWIPSRNGYGETGSASNFLDWQARRLNARYKDTNGQLKYVYMLNDTALPSPRILIAILENYQQKDGSIKVPDVLVPYLGGIKTIRR
jgi:seryl-tRNA synthetase